MRKSFLAFPVLVSLISCGSSTTSPIGESSGAQSSSREKISSEAISSPTNSSSSNESISVSSAQIHSSSSAKLNYGTLHDNRDGKDYLTIRIGQQIWMAQNLNYGTMVIGSVEQEDDGAAEKYCSGDDENNCDRDGALYQWAEAMDLSYSCNSLDCASQISAKQQGICPDGWHVPTTPEYQTLKAYLDPGMLQDAGQYLKSDTTGNSSWDQNSNAGNPYGFGAVPAGRRSASEKIFEGQRGSAGFWTATPLQNTQASAFSLEQGSSGFYNEPTDLKNGFSLRCIQDL